MGAIFTLSAASGIMMFMANPAAKALSVRTVTILIAEEPVFFCTAVSVIILWAQRIMVARMVTDLTSMLSVDMTAIAE
ncbi:hypothetical protein SDC9_62972 [bioreactor metagenome]|uniref:Uncharacterized protein n=1 Tax=bioreactor metagenome TaxID=1076179 RepID=A0A644XL85_9ZZZZ